MNGQILLNLQINLEVPINRRTSRDVGRESIPQLHVKKTSQKDFFKYDL